MKTNFKSLALAALVLLGMGACSNELDEQLQQTEGQALTFNFSINNGATTKTITNSEDRVTSWDKGDEVGLFVYKKDDVIGTDIPVHANIKLSYDGTKWNSASSIFSDADYDFYAYYPYQAAASDPTKIALPAKADQSKEADYGLSDVMAAPKVTVVEKGTQVDLTFKHVFSLVEIQVSGDLVTAAPSNVILKNVKTASSLNLATTEATISGDASDVIPQALGAKGNVYAYRAVVPAQTITANTSLVQLQNAEKHYAFKYSTDVAYEAGKYRTLSVLINKAKVELTIPNPGITPWEPSGPGSGEGGTEEIVPKPELITQFELPLDAYVEPESVIGSAGSGALTSSKDEWFHREKSSNDIQTNISVEGTTLNLTNPASKKGSWNNSGVVFHKFGAFERTTYKVTVTASSTIDGGSIGLTVSNSNDTKRFKMFNDKGVDWARNVTTFGSLSASSHTTKTFYIDCSNASEKGSSSGLKETDYMATTEEDVATGIFVTLYNYTNNTAENTVIVENVKIEKAALPAAAK